MQRGLPRCWMQLVLSVSSFTNDELVPCSSGLQSEHPDAVLECHAPASGISCVFFMNCERMPCSAGIVSAVLLMWELAMTASLAGILDNESEGVLLGGPSGIVIELESKFGSPGIELESPFSSCNGKWKGKNPSSNGKDSQRYSLQASDVRFPVPQSFINAPTTRVPGMESQSSNPWNYINTTFM